MTEFDLSPDFDFAASMREAEERAMTEQPEVQLSELAPDAAAPVEGAPQGRERNEKGQFVAAQTETEAEPEPQVEAEPSAAEQLLAGRFKSVEELERGYEEALKKLSQRDEKAAGYDELKAAFDERFAGLEERFNQPAPRHVEITEDLVDRNPAYATQLAFEQQNPVALQYAFETWKDLDPGAAATWAAARQMEMREQAIRAEYEQRFAALEERFAPVAEATENQQWARAYQQIAAKYPDLEQLAPVMSEIAPEYPVVLQTLQAGTPESRAQALESLYLIARGRNAGNLHAAEQAAAASSAEQAEAARRDAFVASTVQTSAPPPQTYEEEQAARLTERIRSKQAMWDSGWDRS